MYSNGNRRKEHKSAEKDGMNRDNPSLRISNVMYECGCFRFVICFRISSHLLALCIPISEMFSEKNCISFEITYSSFNSIFIFFFVFRTFSSAFTVTCSLYFFRYIYRFYVLLVNFP